MESLDGGRDSVHGVDAMSQCYRVSLKSSICRTVEGEDSVSYPIELTEILPPEEMASVLREALERDDWERLEEGDDNKWRTTGPAGEELVIDLDEMEITATIHEESEVSAEVEVTGIGEGKGSAQQDAQHQLREQEQATGDAIEDAGRRDLREQIREKLEESEKDRARQVNRLLQEVYAESLKRKAGQLGEILDIQEGTGASGDYELTIRVGQ